MSAQRDLSKKDKAVLAALLKKCGYENVLSEIVGLADKMSSVSGNELAGQLDGFMGNFGYFPVCSLEDEGAVGHDRKGVCSECGTESDRPETVVKDEAPSLMECALRWDRCDKECSYPCGGPCEKKLGHQGDRCQCAPLRAHRELLGLCLICGRDHLKASVSCPWEPPIQVDARV